MSDDLAETPPASETADSESDDRFPGLTTLERFNVRAVELWHAVRPLSRVSTWISHRFTPRLYAPILHNVLADHHFERLRTANYDHGILICANHRSYIDNFAIGSRAAKHAPDDVRIVAPARTESLFDVPWGIVLNVVLTAMSIYPPVVRSKRGIAWGKRVIAIVTDLLLKGRVMVFIHPEGGRNKGSDPYTLLAPRPGLGKIIYHTRASVFPVFLHGFPRTPGTFLAASVRRRRPLVHAVMGERLDFDAERARPASPRLYAEISQRVADAIVAASIEERELRARDLEASARG